VVDDTNTRLDFEAVYRRLRGDCRIFFGFKLLAGGYPDWVATTRPYYETGYVLVAPPPQPASLEAMPRDRALAVAIGSAADFRFVQYNNALPADRRFRRFPYRGDAEAMQAVVDGQAAAALVWGPAFSHLRSTEPAFAAFAEFSPAPLELPAVPVGAILLDTDTFLRQSVDEAIASLVADGSIARILSEQGMPGTARQ
jgi:polar amino acid transport system substrate-binding protein